EEDQGGREEPGPPDRAQGGGPATEADPEAARKEIAQDRADERHAQKDLTAIEERERDREGKQSEQVEVTGRERFPQIREPEEEHEAEPEPDGRLHECLCAQTHST